MKSTLSPKTPQRANIEPDYQALFIRAYASATLHLIRQGATLTHQPAPTPDATK